MWPATLREGAGAPGHASRLSVAGWAKDASGRMPARRAFRTGRVIAGDGFARIAKAHRENGDLARVVELLRRQTKPVAQPVAGRIVPGNAGFMHLSTGRLTDNAQPR